MTPGARLVLPAPAKLNLFLHVVGRRADGYHLLQTVFQLLDFGDELAFARREDDALVLSSELPGVASQDNLIVRAGRLLQRHTGCRAGADIQLTKRLPMGGGLGGGSSDAASTLLALNSLWDLGLDTDTLASLGLQLGADVPVFVRGRSSWAEGVGEQLTPIDLPPRWFLVIAPDCAVNTAAIFQARELTRNTPTITIAAFSEGGGLQATHNDCQPVVEKRYPAVKAAIDWLSAYAPCRMTGTGASVFASFATQAEAEAVLARKPAHWAGFVAQGVNQSPAHRHLP